MFTILLSIFCLLIIIFGNGFLWAKVLKINDDSFVLTSFLGIVGMTILQTLIAFFYTLGSGVEIFFILLGILGFAICLKKKSYSYFNFSKNLNFWFYFFAILILFLASFSPILYDHFSYYISTISYLKQFGFVKGISSLDLLLGQSSFWHIFQAGFSHFVDPFLKINSYLSVLFLIYIYERKQYFLLIFLPVYLLFVQQPSPDLPILIITLVVINELINRRNNPIILYLAMLAFCIKPIVFWLPLFVILQNIFDKNISFKTIIPVSMLGILLLMKNLWLFGFPIFPVSILDFNLAWKPSQEMLTYSSQIGLMKTYDMKYSYQQVIDFSFWQSIYRWFTIGFKSVFNLGILICLMIISYFSFRKKDRIYKILLICIIIKFILIIIFSAQYRFFIDVYLIAIFLVFKNISEEKAVFVTAFLSVLISVLFIFPGFLHNFNIGKRLSGFNWAQIYKPVENNLININSEYKIGNLNFYVPQNPFEKQHFPWINSYDLKLYDYYGIFPQQIGNEYKDGFYQRKLTPKEKIQLKKIIAETEKYKP